MYCWRNTGVPKRAWAALKKEFEIINLVRSLDKRITMDDIINDHDEFNKQAGIK